MDGNLITGAAWPGHPEFLSLLLKALGLNVTGSGKKVLMLCGVRGKKQKELSADVSCFFFFFFFGVSETFRVWQGVDPVL